MMMRQAARIVARYASPCPFGHRVTPIRTSCPHAFLPACWSMPSTVAAPRANKKGKRAHGQRRNFHCPDFGQCAAANMSDQTEIAERTCEREQPQRIEARPIGNRGG